MAISLFQLVGSIFVDSEKAEESIKKTEKESSKLSETLSAGIQTAGKWAAGFATAAAGAAVAIGTAAVNTAMDVDKAMNDFAASTGIAKDELGEYEDTLLNIYNNNFGESFEDIAASMGTIKQIMGEGMGAEELEQVTQNALMLRDTFDFDVAESVRAVNSMMDQFGVTSEEAYNLIAQGAQNGLNQNGDLMDVVNEYSNQFAMLGYNAEDMFNMLSNGAESGTWSVDKLGDAMKEFGIRAKDGSKTTADAFATLGLAPQEMFEKFAAGGEDAKAATQEVVEALFAMEDKVAQDATGVALFGTMWEDLGADAIAALVDTQGEISNTTDALAEINSIKYDDLGSMFEGLKRNIETLLLPLGNALMPVLMQVIQLIQDNMPLIEGMIATLTPIIQQLFDSVVPPLMDLISTLLPPLMDVVNMILPILSELLVQLMPIFTQIVEAVFPVLIDLIDMLLPPLMDIVNMILPIVSQLLPPILALLEPIISLLQPIIELAMALIEPLMQILNAVLPPLTEALSFFIEGALENLKNSFDNVVKTIKDVLKIAIDYFKSQFAIAKDIFKNIIDFIKNVFTGNWKSAFENIKNILGNIFKGMANAVKAPINVIIGLINGLVSGVVSGVNGVINMLNKLKIDIPDWVPGFGGTTFGFNINPITAPKIPLLAKGGTVVEEGSAIVGEAGAELISLPQGARVAPLTNGGDPIGFKAVESKLDTMIELLSAILKKEGVLQIGETQFLNYVNKSLGALI